MEDIVSIYHTAIETPLVLSPSAVQLLIVENPHEFYRFVSGLDAQLEGEDGEFSFLRDDKSIAAEKEGCIICDPFHFELNDKKAINLLVKRLSDTCRYGEMHHKLIEINASVEMMFSELFSSFPFSLAHSELTIENLLKVGDVRFEKTYDSLIEKFICYINAMVELKQCRFFVFVNLKSVLGDDELKALYHHCALEKVGLLLIEPAKSRALLPEEKAVIITDDLCEIVENYGEL